MHWIMHIYLSNSNEPVLLLGAFAGTLDNLSWVYDCYYAATAVHFFRVASLKMYFYFSTHLAVLLMSICRAIQLHSVAVLSRHVQFTNHTLIMTHP